MPLDMKSMLNMFIQYMWKRIPEKENMVSTWDWSSVICSGSGWSNQFLTTTPSGLFQSCLRLEVLNITWKTMCGVIDFWFMMSPLKIITTVRRKYVYHKKSFSRFCIVLKTHHSYHLDVEFLFSERKRLHGSVQLVDTFW
jgi:hypothetical protein